MLVPHAANAALHMWETESQDCRKGRSPQAASRRLLFGVGAGTSANTTSPLAAAVAATDSKHATPPPPPFAPPPPDPTRADPPSRAACCHGSILDGQVHSVIPNDGKVLTLGAYYDYLATLPVLIPEGPVSVLGLAAGTVARAMHRFFPDRHDARATAPRRRRHPHNERCPGLLHPVSPACVPAGPVGERA